MKYFTIILLIMLCFNLNAQDKQDNIWLFGHEPNRPVDFFGGSMIDFNTSPPSIKYFNIFMRLVDCSSICDENGSLLFYTNNCALYDQNHILSLIHI